MGRPGVSDIKTLNKPHQFLNLNTDGIWGQIISMWGIPVHCRMFASIPCPPPDASSTPPPLFATKLSHVIARCSPGAPSESHWATVIRWCCLRSNKWNRMAQKKYLTFWKVLSSWKASLIAQLVRNPGDPSSIPGSGRSAGEGIGYPLKYSGASLVAQLVKNPVQETWVWSLGWEVPLEKGKATSVFWPGEFHRLYSSWTRKEWDTTERLTFTFIFMEV